jgi:hypothetical protein
LKPQQSKRRKPYNKNNRPQHKQQGYIARHQEPTRSTLTRSSMYYSLSLPSSILITISPIPLIVSRCITKIDTSNSNKKITYIERIWGRQFLKDRMRLLAGDFTL